MRFKESSWQFSRFPHRRERHNPFHGGGEGVEEFHEEDAQGIDIALLVITGPGPSRSVLREELRCDVQIRSDACRQGISFLVFPVRQRRPGVSAIRGGRRNSMVTAVSIRTLHRRDHVLGKTEVADLHLAVVCENIVRFEISMRDASSVHGADPSHDLLKEGPEPRCADGGLVWLLLVRFTGQWTKGTGTVIIVGVAVQCAFRVEHGADLLVEVRLTVLHLNEQIERALPLEANMHSGDIDTEGSHSFEITHLTQVHGLQRGSQHGPLLKGHFPIRVPPMADMTFEIRFPSTFGLLRPSPRRFGLCVAAGAFGATRGRPFRRLTLAQAGISEGVWELDFVSPDRRRCKCCLR